MRTKDIERRFHVGAGSLRRVGEEYTWLVEALGAIAQACGWPEARRQELDELSDRLVHGVRSDALVLARLRSRGLGRVLIRRLAAAGYASPDAVRAAGADVVRKAINHRRAFAALWAKLNEQAAPTAPARYPTATDQPAPVLMAAEPVAAYGADGAEPPAGPGPVLVVNLCEHRVIYRGRDIPTRPPNNIQRQPFLALAVLAGRPGGVVTMAEIAEGMFKLGSLRKRPVAPDARDLRYKLLRPFKKALNDGVSSADVERLIESFPGVGLRLNVDGKARVIVAGA